MAEEERVTMAENRDLRMAIYDITSGCFLTQREYNAIMEIVRTAVLREAF